MKLRAGDWVEVRSKEEILRSLDGNGRLEGLPFMPQMLEYCGRQFRVYKRAHKTCDTVNQTGGRWLTNAVHLELRCDGKAYGGCQAACLIFWKEVWLKPVDGGSKSADDAPRGEIARANGTGCSEVDVWKATRSQDHELTGDTIYCCQATQLPHFTTHAPWWDPRQYIEDYTSRNIKFDQMVRILAYAVYYPFCRPSRGKLELLGNFFAGFTINSKRSGGACPSPEGEEPCRPVNPLRCRL